MSLAPEVDRLVISAKEEALFEVHPDLGPQQTRLERAHGHIKCAPMRGCPPVELPDALEVVLEARTRGGYGR